MHEFASYQNMSYCSHLQEKTEVKREIFVFVRIGGSFVKDVLIVTLANQSARECTASGISILLVHPSVDGFIVSD